MTRRRWTELIVAAGVFLLLLAVFLVRPTARKTGAPASIVLFERATGAPPDFGNDSYASISAASPDSSRVLVVYPAEFEQRADVYVMDAARREGYRLVLDDSLHAQDSPKAVGWLDASRAWVVIGFTQGTVSPGGDLFEFDPSTGRARVLWASPDSGRTQAVAFVPPGTVRLRAFDANQDNPRDSTIVLPAEALAAAAPAP
jgi:hypothetical protein